MNKNKYLKINFRRKPDNEKKKQKGWLILFDDH
jgi:hypothetical protein